MHTYLHLTVMACEMLTTLDKIFFVKTLYMIIRGRAQWGMGLADTKCLKKRGIGILPNFFGHHYGLLFEFKDKM